MASAPVIEAKERRRARQALEELEELSSDELTLSRGDEMRVERSGSVVGALLEILGHLSRGQRVTITPLDAQLTTGGVAQALGCSSAHVVKLIADEL